MAESKDPEFLKGLPNGAESTGVALVKRVIPLESILKSRPDAEILKEFEAKARARFAAKDDENG